eukprot:scpid97207/ scgid5263/ 
MDMEGPKDMPSSTGSRASIGGVSGVCGDHLRLVDCLPRFESTLENILKLVTQEVSASLDREAYLLRKIKDLSSQLQALQSQFELLQRPQPDCEKAQDADTQDENLKIPVHACGSTRPSRSLHSITASCSSSWVKSVLESPSTQLMRQRLLALHSGHVQPMLDHGCLNRTPGAPRATTRIPVAIARMTATHNRVTPPATWPLRDPWQQQPPLTDQTGSLLAVAVLVKPWTLALT